MRASVLERCYDGARAKRESGANPGQTRCCKSRERLTNNATAGRWEGGKTEMSQNTCRCTDCNISRGLELCKAEEHYFRLFIVCARSR